MKIKTAELTGPALDWAVAMCEKVKVRIRTAEERRNTWTKGLDPASINALDKSKRWEPEVRQTTGVGYGPVYNPSIFWSQGGPIIEREEITVSPSAQSKGEWIAAVDTENERIIYLARTPLIAAMRCYVASNLGDEVDISEELK